MAKKASDPPEPVDIVDERLLFNQRATARFLGISARNFADWPIVPRDRSGRESLYYWPEVQAERDRRLLEREAGPLKARIAELEKQLELAGLDLDGEDGAMLDLDAERARLAAEQADKIAMENAITRGEVAYLPDVATEQGRVFEMIRAKSLAMPTKCAPLANPENPNLARDVIEREVLELLTEIAAAEFGNEPSERVDDVQGAAVDTQAAAETNGHAVGRRKKTAKPGK
jgi:phage terminase Nu1 subunit (DNA packaging protein)